MSGSGYVEGLVISKHDAPLVKAMIDHGRRWLRQNGLNSDPPAIAGFLRQLDALVAVQTREGGRVDAIGPQDYGQGWLTITDAAAALGLSPRRLRQMCAEGKVTAKRAPGGRTWLVHPGAVTVRAA